MNFENLTANALDMRASNEDVLSVQDYRDSDLIKLYKDVAKVDLKIDLQNSLGLELSDLTSLDLIADKYSERLSRALAYKQLIYFYQNKREAVDSQSDMRYKMYLTKYNDIKATFSQMKDITLSQIVSITVVK